MGSRLETNSTNVRKRIESHTFDNEDGEEYEASKFGGFSDYFRRKKLKLQNLDADIRAKSQDNPPIFRGVVAHVNGYTQPSLNDLHAMIVGYGGGFLQYLDGKTTVTHVIASNLTPKKKVEFQRYRIVSPQWVVDSIKAGKLQPWDQYRVVDEGSTQKVLSFDNGQFMSQNNTQNRTYRDQTDASWYTSQLKKANGESGSDDSTPKATLMLPPGPSKPQFSDSFIDEYIPDDSVVANELEEDFDFEDEQHFPNNGKNRADINDREDEDQIAISNAMDSAEASKEVFKEVLQQAARDPTKSPKNRPLTAEEHNAILLSDPRMAKTSVVNPDFLKQYYKESRLHHLSTWKAELKAQLQALTQEKAKPQSPHQKRVPGARRYVMHVDFDSFFAAVSLRKHPELVDKPVVIAHGSGAGSEIASCNYPARAFGVKNGMWMKSALQLCPDLKVLPYDYKAYEDASRLFYEAIMATGGIVQSVSIDEALVDITSLVLPAGGSDGRGVSEGSIFREQSKADEIGQNLRATIKEKTECNVSVGIGANILLAKVALRKAKPAGQYQIKPEGVLDFIGELTVKDLPGVAYSIGGKLEEIGVKYVKDIRALTKERLINALGPKTGEKIWEYSRGIDHAEVGEQVVRKSVSAEVNWGIRFVTQAQADEFVLSLCEELSKRLLENSVKGRQLTMKIMRRSADAPLDPPKHLGHGKCDTFNKSIVLGVATNSKDVLGREAVSILKGFGFSPGELRGLGVQMTRLEPLKAIQATPVDSSQKRLQFKQTETTPKKVKDAIVKDATDPIEDIKSPEKKRSSPTSTFNGMPKSDPKDKPLNVAGTQFILPSQIDPSVLAELPPDIRANLVAESKVFQLKSASRNASPASSGGNPKSRSQSPFTELPTASQIDPETLAALPEDVQAELRTYYAQSTKRQPAQQLLPQSPHKNRTISNPPKKTQTTPTKRKGTSLLTRGRPSKSTSTTTSKLTQSAFVSARTTSTTASTSRQGPRTPPPNDDASAEPSLGEISPSFLAALPPDIRAELLAQQRQERLKAKSGLSVSLPSKSRSKANASGYDILAGGQRTIKLPPRPEKPSFTSRKLTKMNELRDAIKGWVEMFKEPTIIERESLRALQKSLDERERQHAKKTSQMGIGDGFYTSPNKNANQSNPQDDEDEEDGPYDEDTQALSTYLIRVIKEENDLAKATDLVKWLEWCVGELIIVPINEDDSNEQAEIVDPEEHQLAQELAMKKRDAVQALKGRWDTIVNQLKHDVRTAAEEKGFEGELDLD